MSSKKGRSGRLPGAKPADAAQPSERMSDTLNMHRVERKTQSRNKSAESNEVKLKRRNTELMLTVGENIRTLRVNLALTQTELAKKANISTTQLGKIERGSAGPSLTTLERLAKALGAPLGPIFPSSPITDYEEDASTRTEAPPPDSRTLLEYVDLTARDTLRNRASDYVEAVDLPDGWFIAVDGNAYKVEGWSAENSVELLLSASRVAELLHFSDRTLQKWIEQKHLTPSFYLAQGRIGGVDKGITWTPHLVAAFRLSNLLDAVQARSKGKVSKKRKRTADEDRQIIEGS